MHVSYLIATLLAVIYCSTEEMLSIMHFFVDSRKLCYYDMMDKGVMHFLYLRLPLVLKLLRNNLVNSSTPTNAKHMKLFPNRNTHSFFSEDGPNQTNKQDGPSPWIFWPLQFQNLSPGAVRLALSMTRINIFSCI